MNRHLIEKIVATVFVLAIFGGIYFLIATFTKDKTEKKLLKPITQTQTIPRNQNLVIPAIPTYYYLEDFYTESTNGLMLKTHSNQNFSYQISAQPVQNIRIDGPILSFTENKNGSKEQQFFNLEALTNQLNNQP